MSRGRRHRTQTTNAAAPAQPVPGREAETDRLRQSNGSVTAVRRLLENADPSQLPGMIETLRNANRPDAPRLVPVDLPGWGGYLPRAEIPGLIDGAGRRLPAPQPAGPPTEEEQFRSNPPARYASLPRDLVEVLAASRDSCENFRSVARTPQTRLWDLLDGFETGQLQALIQTYRGAVNLGIWPLVERLKNVYAYSSWGFDWFGDRAALLGMVRNSQQYCHDFDAWQEMFHERGLTWWRHTGGGAGRPGMHIGVGESVSHNNTHWDSNNPASGRNNGVAGAIVPGWGADRCRYSIGGTMGHGTDILGAGHDQPMPFVALDRLRYVSRRVSRAVAGSPGTGGRATAAAALTALHQRVEALQARARPMAASEGGSQTADQEGIGTETERLAAELLPHVHAVARQLIPEMRRAGGVLFTEEISSMMRFEAIDWPGFSTGDADRFVDIYGRAARAIDRPGQ